MTVAKAKGTAIPMPREFEAGISMVADGIVTEVANQEHLNELTRPTDDRQRTWFLDKQAKTKALKAEKAPARKTTKKRTKK